MPLNWALTVATYNRPDALRRTVEHALGQTFKPAEVIIVDSSSGVSTSEAELRELILKADSTIRFAYIRSPVAQQTVQRNMAIRASSADILFMIDDDAYLYPSCAEKVMAIFAADTQKQVAVVGPAPAANPPSREGEPPREYGTRSKPSRVGHIALRAFGVKYWPCPPSYPPFTLPTVDLPLRQARMVHGFRFIARREVAAKCLFDENLVTGLHEDLDASYRFAQHGALVELDLPLVYHDWAARPKEQPRKGAIQRFGWIGGHVYLCRRYFGNSLYVRLHAFFSMWRYLPLDVIDGTRRRDYSRLRGTIDGLRAAWRVAMAPDEQAGAVYAAQCRAYRQRILAQPLAPSKSGR